MYIPSFNKEKALEQQIELLLYLDLEKCMPVEGSLPIILIIMVEKELHVLLLKQ